MNFYYQAKEGIMQPCQYTSQIKHWIYLIIAILLEVIGTSVMKLSQLGTWIFEPNIGYLLMLICIGLSYYMLALTATGLPIGVAYAFWEGLGLILITLISIFVIDEKMTITRLISLFAVLSGAILIHHGTVNISSNN